MKSATLEKLVWVLIFGGMVSATLGWFVNDKQANALGSVLLLGGSVAALAGVVLIFVRARRRDP